MKRLFLLIVIISLASGIFGQPPQKLSYQAVIRKSTGSLVANQTIGMKISILQGSVTGTAVYVETQTPITDANGLVTIEIGGGTPVKGTFAGITWSANTFFIKTETDPKGGTDYSITGTGQILSVPFALYAASAPPTTNANAISSGNLDPLYYSAYQDLIEEGRLDNTTGTDILTRTQADSRYNQKIGFFAFNSDDDYTNEIMNKVEFNQAPFDDGNCFDNTRDRFVAPVAGVYSFSVNVGLNTHGGTAGTFIYDLFIYRNGIAYCLLGETDSGTSTAVNGSVTLKLAASDYVEVFVSGFNARIHGDINGIHNTCFSGHLVYPTSF